MSFELVVSGFTSSMSPYQMPSVSMMTAPPDYAAIAALARSFTFFGTSGAPPLPAMTFMLAVVGRDVLAKGPTQFPKPRPCPERGETLSSDSVAPRPARKGTVFATRTLALKVALATRARQLAACLQFSTQRAWGHDEQRRQRTRLSGRARTTMR